MLGNYTIPIRAETNTANNLGTLIIIKIGTQVYTLELQSGPTILGLIIYLFIKALQHKC